MRPENRIDAATLEGSVLTGVTASWHVFDGERGEWPRLYLTFDQAGLLEVSLPGDGSLGLLAGNQPESFDMGEYGSALVELEPPSVTFTAYIGQRVERVIELVQAQLRYPCGAEFAFSAGAVGLANINDEQWCMPWPDVRWVGNCVEAA